ncbi:nectin-4 isoform X1 [Hippocampus zosterae]|uniref:nectin-4 isoform X1 n=2 Tax=Hippocampus zosterae TaxID=109293 RepID=UPI00223E0392|nr:nectin-4 isoform X1 [Hippocampus zosterae]
MTSWLRGLSLCLLVPWISVTGEFVKRPPNDSIYSLAEKETVLPCRFQPEEMQLVVQVTWYRETPDGWDQIITAHHIDGQTAFGAWSGRVRFNSSIPTEDSSLVLLSTDVSDEGRYTCHVNSYPLGNFDQIVTLMVWTIPISSLDPVILVEGQSYRQAASCRSLARPAPQLSWDTELHGQSINRSWANGAITTHFSLHPLRKMNGKKLDCLVWHPTLTAGPRRHQNKLVVHFPPDSEVSGYNGDWYVGLEHASLTCVSGGNPKPQQFTWARHGKALPDGLTPHPNGTLEFRRPLSLSDSGTYQCVAKNEVGVGTAEVEIFVSEFPERQIMSETTTMVVVGVIAVGLLLLMLVIIITVTCHHKKKNKKLKRELTEKKEEISSLSWQASLRRINSVSTDARGATEESIPLRVEGTMSSLGELAPSRDSRSTIMGGRSGGGEGGGGAYDYLGRPVQLNSQKGRESLLDHDEQGTSLPCRVPTPLTIKSTDMLGEQNEEWSRPASSVRSLRHTSPSYCTPSMTDNEDEVDEGLGGPASQEHPDDRESQSSHSQVSEAHSHNQLTNGTKRFKTEMGHTLVGPHASLVHKVQIV